MKHFLWTGVIVKPEVVANFKVVSAAANNWQLGFINGLISNGCNVTCISYSADSYWPKGRILPKLKAIEVPDYLNVIRVSYFNLPLLREFSLFLSLIFIVITHGISFNVLITYNPFKRHIFLGKFVKYWLNKIWVLIIADGDYSGFPDLSIYLSHETFLSKCGNKYFLQGGIADFIPLINSQVLNRNIVYAGNISKLTGIVEFASQFNQLDYNRLGLEFLELHIYGKGEDKYLNNLAKINPRIKVFGFVDDEELKIAMQEA
jgi:glycosyltransferase involved in cell wall biosynthesis